MLSFDPPVTTERLLLRAFAPTDLDAAHALGSDPEVVRYIPWPVRTLEQSQQWLDDRVRDHVLAEEGDNAAWAVVRRSDDALIGSVNAWWRSERDRAGEIGYVLARHGQGQGYAAEAVRCLVDQLFGQLDLHRVVARLDARNTASARLLARLGMRQEAHFRQDEWFKDEWTDTLVFAVLREEWLG